MENLLGKTILGYRLVEVLGSGSFGTVYKAVKENATGTYVRALKVITLPNDKQYSNVLNSMGGDITKTNAYFDQLFNEIFSEVKVLNDFTERDVPNVVRYYEHDLNINENPKRYNLYILMEYLTPLNQYLSSNAFTVNDAINMSLDILQGLSASHKSGVIHRDVKLDNIFVNNNNNFKIGDFGVSKILDKETRAQSLKGTPDFIAPEVYLGKEDYDESVDLYSLGIVLYRLLNYNRNPFLPSFPNTYTPSEEDFAFNKRIAGEIPALPILGGEEIGNVILKAIAPREDRFATADEFYTALANARNNTPIETLDIVINGEGTPFYNTYSSLNETSNLTLPSYDETVNSGYSPIGNNAQTISQNSQAYSQPSYDTYSDSYQNPRPVSTTSTGSTSAVQEKPNKKPIYWIVGILGVLIILAAAYLMFGRNTSPAVEITPVSISPPTYSITAGQYSVPQYIKINDNDPNVKIYYTLDGTEPTESSIQYANGEEIKVSSNTTLRSIAVDSDGNKSPVTSADYVITESSPDQNSVQVTPSYNTFVAPSNNYYLLPDSNSRVISEAELYGLTEDQVALARNEIFARKGRMFDTDWIANYFNNQDWYVPKYSPEEFDASSTSILSNVERQNVQIIQDYEERMGYVD